MTREYKACEELSVAEQKSLILSVLYMVVEAEDSETAMAYLEHAGFDLSVVEEITNLEAAWLGHYRIRQGCYDADRACEDFARWPPIAARIAELRAENSGV